MPPSESLVFLFLSTRKSALRALYPASQDICSLMSARKTNASFGVACFSFLSTRKSALRALYPASQDICSLMSARKTNASFGVACFSFALIISYFWGSVYTALRWFLQHHHAQIKRHTQHQEINISELRCHRCCNHDRSP